MASYMEYYNFIMDTKRDPRTTNWFLINSPGPLLTILVTYLYFCISAGPRYMKDRKPYDLKNAIMIYNAVQVAFSIFLVYEGLQGGWASYYKFGCQPVDYSDNPKATRMAAAVWWYFMCKLIELLDTVFFILRKKHNQVSYLHLYHHSLMPICAWIGVKFLPGGHGTLLGLINSFIHIIMYSYYLMASMGPRYQKYLWWKKYLTAMQMVQFCIVAIHNIQMLFRNCDYPKVIAFLLGTQACYFFYLFGMFYYKSYILPEKKNALLSKTDGSKSNGNIKSDKCVKKCNESNQFSKNMKSNDRREIKEN